MLPAPKPFLSKPAVHQENAPANADRVEILHQGEDPRHAVAAIDRNPRSGLNSLFCHRTVLVRRLSVPRSSHVCSYFNPRPISRAASVKAGRAVISHHGPIPSLSLTTRADP